MPIVIQSSGSLVFGSGSSIVTSAPSGVAVGDLLVLFVSTEHSQANTTPTGWTLAGSASVGSGQIQSVIWWRIADGTADDTPTVSLTLADDHEALLIRLDGQDATTPFDTADTYTQVSGTTPEVPLITTSVSNGFVLAFSTLPINIYASSPSGYTTEHSSSIHTAIRVWSKTVGAAGAYGPDSFGTFASTSAALVAVAFAETTIPTTNASLYPPSIPPANNFGTHTLQAHLELTGIEPTGGFGSHTLIDESDTTGLILPSIAPTNNFGTHDLRAEIAFLTGIAPTNAFGNHRLHQQGDIVFEGIAPTGGFGDHQLVNAGDKVISFAGIAPTGGFGQAVLADPATTDFTVRFLTGRTRRIKMTGSYSFDFWVDMNDGTLLAEGFVEAGFDYNKVAQLPFLENPNPLGTVVFARNHIILTPTPTIPDPGKHRLEIRGPGNQTVFLDTNFHIVFADTPNPRNFPQNGTFEVSGLMAEWFRTDSNGQRSYGEVLVPGSRVVKRIGGIDAGFAITRWFQVNGFYAYYPYVQGSAFAGFRRVFGGNFSFSASASWSWSVDYGGETLGMVAASASSGTGSASAGSATATSDAAYNPGPQFASKGAVGTAGYYCARLPNANVTLTGKYYNFSGIIDKLATFKDYGLSINVGGGSPRHTFSGTGQASTTISYEWHHAAASVFGHNQIESQSTDITPGTSGPLPSGFTYWITGQADTGSIDTLIDTNPVPAYAKRVDATNFHKAQYRYVAQSPTWAPILPGFGRGWYRYSPSTVISVVSGKLRIESGSDVAIGGGFPGNYNKAAYLVEDYRTENRYVRVRIRSVGSANKRFRFIVENSIGSDPNGWSLAWTDETGADGVWVERVFDKYQAEQAGIYFVEGPSAPIPYPAYTRIPPLDIITRTAIDYLEVNTTYEIEFIRWERVNATSGATLTVEQAVYQADQSNKTIANQADLRGQSETVPTLALAAPADPLAAGQQDGSWEATDLIPPTAGKPSIPDSDSGATLLMLPEDLLYESDLLGQFHFNSSGSLYYPYLLYGGGQARTIHGAQVDLDVADPGGTTVWAAMPVLGLGIYRGCGNVLDPTAPYSPDTTLEFSWSVWMGHYGGVLNGVGQEVVHIETGPPEVERSRVTVDSEEFFRTDGQYGRKGIPQALYVDDGDTERREDIGRSGRAIFEWHLWRVSTSTWLSADLSDTLRAARAYLKNGTIRLEFATLPDGSEWSDGDTDISGASRPCVRYRRSDRMGGILLVYETDEDDDGSFDIIRRVTNDEGGSFSLPITVFAAGYQFPTLAVSPTGMESHFAIRDSDSAIRGVVLEGQGNVQVAEFTAVSGVEADAIAAFVNPRTGRVYLVYRDATGIHRVYSDDLTTFSGAVSLFSTGYQLVGAAVSPTGMEHYFAIRDSDNAIRGIVIDGQGSVAIAEFTAVAGSIDVDAIAAYERYGYIYLLYRDGGEIETVRSSDLTTFA